MYIYNVINQQQSATKPLSALTLAEEVRVLRQKNKENEAENRALKEEITHLKNLIGKLFDGKHPERFTGANQSDHPTQAELFSTDEENQKAAEQIEEKPVKGSAAKKYGNKKQAKKDKKKKSED